MDSQPRRILIVDDEASLLKVMHHYLSRLGYQVDACRNAAAAWELLRSNPSAYASVLVDLNMPGMRGEELARRILASNASIRLVVVSGYPAALGSFGSLDGDRVSFLPKPFAPQELAAALAGGLSLKETPIPTAESIDSGLPR
ncbi:MAG TPA: response regulator [Bryobacteraceae bacterium]|nr:response regulator [Bryobacteraceae bacterium]